MRIKTRILSRIIDVDVRLLIATSLAIRFCVEWFSWSTDRIERSLIAGYGIFSIVFFVSSTFFPWHFSYHPSTLSIVGGLSTGAYAALACFVCVSMQTQQRASDSVRATRMFMWLIPRVVSAAALGVIAVSNLAFAVSEKHIPWPDVAFLIAYTCFAAAQYAMSMPRGGEPGRRRKLRIEQLKQLFGRPWIPVAQPWS